MRVGVGVKESSKKTLVSTWAGHVETMGDEKMAKRGRCPESGGEMDARKTEIATGTAVKVIL